MRSYHPKSWSQQARRMCDEQIAQIKLGYITVDEALDFFFNSYKHPLVRGRAAARFGRKLREGKIKVPERKEVI